MLNFSSQDYYRNNWGLNPWETQRVHVTRDGRVTVRPVEMTISRSVTGLTVVAGAEPAAVVKAVA